MIRTIIPVVNNEEKLCEKTKRRGGRKTKRRGGRKTKRRGGRKTKRRRERKTEKERQRKKDRGREKSEQEKRMTEKPFSSKLLQCLEDKGILSTNPNYPNL